MGVDHLRFTLANTAFLDAHSAPGASCLPGEGEVCQQTPPRSSVWGAGWTRRGHKTRAPEDPVWECSETWRRGDGVGGGV